MLEKQDEKRILELIREQLTDVRVKKVNDTPQEAFDVANKNYVDTNSASGCVYLLSDSASSGDAKVLFNTELFTTSGITWDSTNNKFIIITAGKYLVTAIVEWGAPTQNYRYGADIYKNTNAVQRSNFQCYISSNNLSSVVSKVLSLVAGDSVHIQARHTNGSTVETIVGGSTYSFMSICRV